jgi:predicted RNA-binding protein with PUA-like domain
MAKPSYWLVKSEPEVYPYAQLEREKRTAWTGVRNFEARNNLRAMRPGDLLLYYHSNEGKEIVGVARVLTRAGPDPTAPREDWSSVEVAPVTTLRSPVPLASIRAAPALRRFPLVKRGRLSVAPVTPEEFACVLELGDTRLPRR